MNELREWDGAMRESHKMRANYRHESVSPQASHCSNSSWSTFLVLFLERLLDFRISLWNKKTTTTTTKELKFNTICRHSLRTKLLLILAARTSPGRKSLVGVGKAKNDHKRGGWLHVPRMSTWPQVCQGCHVSELLFIHHYIQLPNSCCIKFRVFQQGNLKLRWEKEHIKKRDWWRHL